MMDRMVFLGFGKYARADKVYALEPLLGDERGGGRRTRVWVEGIPEPLIASRTERTILHDMGVDAGERSAVLDQALDLAERLSPRLRRKGASTSGISAGERAACSRRRRARRRPSSSSDSRPAQVVLRADVVHEAARELVAGNAAGRRCWRHPRRGGGVRARRSGEPFLPRRTPRNAAMFGPPGHAYVYRSYGIHHCLNLVCGPDGEGAAVLLRAGARPRSRRDAWRRGVVDPRLLCAGPGRLCEALAVTLAHDGLPLDAPPLTASRDREPDVAATTRSGSRVRRSVPRYALPGSRYLSRAIR